MQLVKNNAVHCAVIFGKVAKYRVKFTVAKLSKGREDCVTKATVSTGRASLFYGKIPYIPQDDLLCLRGKQAHKGYKYVLRNLPLPRNIPGPIVNANSGWDPG